HSPGRFGRSRRTSIASSRMTYRPFDTDSYFHPPNNLTVYGPYEVKPISSHARNRNDSKESTPRLGSTTEIISSAKSPPATIDRVSSHCNWSRNNATTALRHFARRLLSIPCNATASSVNERIGRNTQRSPRHNYCGGICFQVPRPIPRK